MSASYSIKNSYLGLKIFTFKNSKHDKVGKLLWDVINIIMQNGLKDDTKKIITKKITTKKDDNIF